MEGQLLDNDNGSIGHAGVTVVAPTRKCRVCGEVTRKFYIRKWRERVWRPRVCASCYSKQIHARAKELNKARPPKERERCYGCQETLPASAFYGDPSRASGLMSLCRGCGVRNRRNRERTRGRVHPPIKTLRAMGLLDELKAALAERDRINSSPLRTRRSPPTPAVVPTSPAVAPALEQHPPDPPQVVTLPGLPQFSAPETTLSRQQRRYQERKRVKRGISNLELAKLVHRKGQKNAKGGSRGHRKDRRSISDLSVADCLALIERQNRHCPRSGRFLSDIGQISTDRIDNNLGYTLNNLELVHPHYNTARGKYSHEEMRDLANDVTCHDLKNRGAPEWLMQEIRRWAQMPELEKKLAVAA